MQETIAWLGLDAHAKHCVLGQLDGEGKRVGHWQVNTNPEELIRLVQSIKADEKHLAVEECGLGSWIAKQLKPHVSEMVVCDPRANALISRNAHKNDVEDAYNLARLLRLGELKAVWQTPQEDRAIFKASVRGYLEAVRRQSALKQQLKAAFRFWGVNVSGSTIYSLQGRGHWLAKLKNEDVRASVSLQYQLLDAALKMESLARRLMTRLGRHYPEIGRLHTVPGVGIIGAHVFVGLIQDPHRFERLSQLMRYCRLSISERSSDGKPLGYPRLERCGYGQLKAISYRAWLTAIKRASGPVYEFYARSLGRTSDEIHARLNTQRKIIQTLWTLWLNEKNFDANIFLGNATQRA